MQKQRATGLCFHCNDKYQPGHRCNPPKFLLLDSTSDTVVFDPTVSLDSTSPAEPSSHDLSPSDVDPFSLFSPSLEPEYLALSPAAYMGFSSPKSLRTHGHIDGYRVSILVDSGSTHNIIQARIASVLHLPVDTSPSFPVMVGNGTFIYCSGRCSNVRIRFTNTEFCLSFFVLPIEGTDLVLGMDWLSSLGSIVADFSIPQLSFSHNNSQVCLVGEPLATSSTPGTLSSMLHKDVVASMFAIFFLPDSPTSPSQSSPPLPALQQLLDQYHSIFEAPTSLPPLVLMITTSR